jgi:hypothetical protein
MARKNQEKSEDLSEVVRKEMIGKKQIPSVLKRGDSFCISGLLINHFAPDIDIEGDAWRGITELVNRYPKYFSDEGYNTRYSLYDSIGHHIESFKEYYRETKKINLRILVSINDESISLGIPFTFSMFADLFSEIGIKIEQLEPVTNYKENDLIPINADSIQVIDNSPKIKPPSFGNMHVDVHLELDPEISKLLSQHISNMLLNQQQTKPQWKMLFDEENEKAKHRRWKIKTEQK